MKLLIGASNISGWRFGTAVYEYCLLEWRDDRTQLNPSQYSTRNGADSACSEANAEIIPCPLCTSKSNDLAAGNLQTA